VETEPKIVTAYIVTGKARLVYRHLLQLGPGSLRTAEASECAADQGAFWPMHDALYARQDQVYRASDLDATLTDFARDLRLDITKFNGCMRSHQHREAIQADNRAAEAAGVRFRPTFDINSARLTGALPFATFQQAIGAAKAR
jgi:protein-disulfide isomerase